MSMTKTVTVGSEAVVLPNSREKGMEDKLESLDKLLAAWEKILEEDVVIDIQTIEKRVCEQYKG